MANIPKLYLRQQIPLIFDQALIKKLIIALIIYILLHFPVLQLSNEQIRFRLKAEYCSQQ